MSHDEQIDLLKRELADLRDRVKRLEDTPASAAAHPYFSLPSIPALPAPQLLVLPGNTWICGCPDDTICMNAACPRATKVACGIATVGPNT